MKGNDYSMAKTKLNPITDKPDNARELTKDFMVGYIKAHGTDEDKAWYLALVKNTPKVKRKNNFTGEYMPTDDIATIRSEFIKRFMPQLQRKGKEKLSYEEQIKREFGL